jgi:SAM-dependent methyltransferase
MADPHGEAMWDAVAGAATSDFYYVRDDGVLDPFPIARRVDASSLIPAEACALEHPHGRVLDVGCGGGKHLRLLAKAGRSGVGVDVSATAISLCRSLGLRRVVVGDAFRPPFHARSFDCITLFSNGLSMGGTLGGVRQLLSELAVLTPETGSIVMTNTDVTKSRREVDRGYQRRNLANGRPVGQVRLRCRYQERDGPWFDWIFLPPWDLPAVLDGTAWRVQRVHEQPDGTYCAMLRR